MNDKVSSVIRQREEQIKDKKAREEFERQQKMLGKSRMQDTVNRENQRLLDKMREKEERYLKLKQEKEEYTKFYSNLKKDLTVKKHGLEDEVSKKVKTT